MTRNDEDFDRAETVAEVEERVQARFPAAPDEIVHDEAVAAVDKYAEAPVKDFIEIIAERDARAAVAETLEGR